MSQESEFLFCKVQNEAKHSPEPTLLVFSEFYKH